MKKGTTSGLICVIAGLLLTVTHSARANADIYWDFDNGFTPTTVQISPGETVTWSNVDPFGFDVRITLDIGYSFFLTDSQSQGVTFTSAGTYGFRSDFGDNGSVTVIVPTPPDILIESPRKQGNQFLFDVTGLTVGKTNVLQASTNLTSWTAISTNLAADTFMTFTNVTTLPRRFFRLVELP